jgi:hypothetical protein
MDPVTRILTMGASGSAAKTYVEDVFSTWLYSGNGSTQTITNGIDLSGKGGLVWTKNRTGAANHALVDTARGGTNWISSSQSWEAFVNDVLSFDSSGYSLLSDLGISNTSGFTYASWTFRKAEKFFDVVTWTGSGANRTISHNLGSVPGCIIVKRTDTTGDWQVYHRSLANTEYMVLNSTAAKATGTTRWNSTTPTSTVFSLGTDATVNASGGTYVAYLFAHDAGGFGDSGNDSVVSCGSFTTDGSGNFSAVNLGYEPQWILIKRTDSSTGGSWVLVDTMRGLGVEGTQQLQPNSSNAEGTNSVGFVRLTSTGFQGASPTQQQASATYIYIAIRRGPMKTPTDATKVFSAITASSDTTGGTTNFPVDWLWTLPRAGGAHRYVFSRLTGAANYLKTSSADLENTGGSLSLASNTSFTGPNLGLSGTIGYEAFRRAPGFFDVVAYTGTGVARTVSHNLGVVPELMIVKIRNDAYQWLVNSQSIAADSILVLNGTSAELTSNPTAFNGTRPTASVFSVGTAVTSNGSAKTYIAYLFASCPGVSKCFNFTGTGTTLQIDCGFTNGARFVMIKRTDSTGDWYVWDSARGIISGNDPYLLLNSTAAEVTNTDYIDSYSAGFEISSTAPAAINANGGSYIGLAIA